MRWVRWAIVVAVGLALAGATAPHLNSGGSGGGSLPARLVPSTAVPSVKVGQVPPVAPATIPPGSISAESGDGLYTPSRVVPVARDTAPGGPNADDAGDRSPLPWILFAAIVITAGLAVRTWWRRRRVVG